MENKNYLRLEAVGNNDVESLKKLSDTSKWERCIHRPTGNSFLHFAVLYHNVKVFDYLLTLSNIPLNHKNKDGDTVLNICFNNFQNQYLKYFKFELIKRGASVDCIPIDEGETFLHYAMYFCEVKVVQVLLDMGYDVDAPNKEGITPLGMCLDQSHLYRDIPKNNKKELATTFLCYGADTTIDHLTYSAYEIAVIYYDGIFSETLFDFLVDQYTSMDIHIEVLFLLARNKSPVFYSTVEHVKNVIVDSSSFEFFNVLCEIDFEYLDALVKKCPNAIVTAFSNVRYPRYPFLSQLNTRGLFRTIHFLLNTDLKETTCSQLSDGEYFTILLRYELNETVILERMCHALSYGLHLTETTLKAIYRSFGFGELMRITLQIERHGKVKWDIEDANLILLLDVHFDFESYFKYSKLKRIRNYTEFLHYFSSRQLRTQCAISDASLPKQPNVPLLVELARNAFRKHFLSTYREIENAWEFHKLLDRLPIARVHKKIITFEKKLY